MTLAHDKRPKATLLIGLCYYALQCQTDIRYELMSQIIRWHSIGWSPIKSQTQAIWPKGKEYNCDMHY
jgi:hypothetical protein